MNRLAVAAAVVLALAAACGTSDEGPSVSSEPRHTAEEVVAAFSDHDVKMTPTRLGSEECNDDEAAYDYGRGDDFERVGVSCTAFVIAPAGGPLPTHVLTPVGRRFLALVYRTRADAERVEAEAPEADASAVFGTPVDYLRRDNVLVLCVGCGADRKPAQAALEDL